jgi:alpha-beta hydrolase superfamily lysophospholipase
MEAMTLERTTVDAEHTDVLRTSAPMELVHFKGASGRPLDGALYRVAPEGDANPGRGVLIVHGKGGNFYSQASRFLPPLLRSAGYTSLALNMSCHDLGYTITGEEHDVPAWGAPKAAGGMWEDLSAGHQEVAVGVEALREVCQGPIAVIGHSSGGFYTLDFLIHGGTVDGVVLLSPLMANRTAFASWFSGPDKEAAALDHARTLVAAGAGHVLVPIDSWYYGISAQSLLQRAEEDPAHFIRGLRASATPLLMAWGTGETRDRAWADAFAEAGAPVKHSFTMPGAGHHYEGFEQELADAITTFVGALH